jgi:hypothetical protein
MITMAMVVIVAMIVSLMRGPVLMLGRGSHLA